MSTKPFFRPLNSSVKQKITNKCLVSWGKTTNSPESRNDHFYYYMRNLAAGKGACGKWPIKRVIQAIFRRTCYLTQMVIRRIKSAIGYLYNGKLGTKNIVQK